MAGCRRLGAAAAARSCAYATCWASCGGGQAPAHSARGGPSPPSAPFGAAGPPHRAPQLNDPRRAAAAAPRPSRCKISAARGGGRAQGLRSPLIASASACRGAEAPFKSGSGGWVAGGWAWSPRALGRRGEACCRLQIARMCVWVLPARLRDAHRAAAQHHWPARTLLLRSAPLPMALRSLGACQKAEGRPLSRGSSASQLLRAALHSLPIRSRPIAPRGRLGPHAGAGRAGARRCSRPRGL